MAGRRERKRVGSSRRGSVSSTPRTSPPRRRRRQINTAASACLTARLIYSRPACWPSRAPLARRRDDIDIFGVRGSRELRARFRPSDVHRNSFLTHRKPSCAPAKGARIRALEGSMDKTNLWETAPSPLNDGEIDALAKRLTATWASSPTPRGRSDDRVVQKLRDGRVRVIRVENTRSRRRPDSFRG